MLLPHFPGIATHKGSSSSIILTAILLLVSLLLPQPTSTFQNQLEVRHGPINGGSIRAKFGLIATSSKDLSKVCNDKDGIHTESSSRQRHASFLLSFWAALFWCSSLHPANAELSDQQYDVHATSTSYSLLVATYASEGSGGLPFLSPFQTPGAVPQTDSKFDDREARNRAFDEAFDQDKRDRDAYYAKMALKARETRITEMQQRRAELGLDAEDAGPRVGEKEADLKSLKKYLLQKDPSTMTPAEFKEFQQIVQK